MEWLMSSVIKPKKVDWQGVQGIGRVHGQGAARRPDDAVDLLNRHGRIGHVHVIDGSGETAADHRVAIRAPRRRIGGASGQGPFTYNNSWPVPVSSTPTTWYQVPAVTAALSTTDTSVAEAESDAGRVKLRCPSRSWSS